MPRSVQIVRSGSAMIGKPSSAQPCPRHCNQALDICVPPLMLRTWLAHMSFVHSKCDSKSSQLIAHILQLRLSNSSTYLQRRIGSMVRNCPRIFAQACTQVRSHTACDAQQPERDGMAWPAAALGCSRRLCGVRPLKLLRGRIPGNRSELRCANRREVTRMRKQNAPRVSPVGMDIERARYCVCAARTGFARDRWECVAEPHHGGQRVA
eukprot:COSAG05_NODE_336_length_11205_cov_4.160544_3_plen_209_part_00